MKQTNPNKQIMKTARNLTISSIPIKLGMELIIKTLTQNNSTDQLNTKGKSMEALYKDLVYINKSLVKRIISDQQNINYNILNIQSTIKIQNFNFSI